MTKSNKGVQEDVKIALQNAANLLVQQPQNAEQQALEILKIMPDFDPVLHILAASYRFQGKLDQALEIIEPLAKRLSNVAPIWLEYGMCLGDAQRGVEAINALRKAGEIDPKSAEIWQAMASQLYIVGDHVNSQKAFDHYLKMFTTAPDFVKAVQALQQGKTAQAEQLTRDIVKIQPTNVAALRLLAEIGLQVNQFKDSQGLLERCLELAPYYHHARHNYVISLLRRQELEAAMQQIEILLSIEPTNSNYLVLKAAILVRKGDNQPALAIYKKVLKEHPNQAKVQLSYGHTLKTVGKLDEAIAAYRKCIEISPSTGETYWSLANLKTFNFSDDDVNNMLEQVTPEGGDPDDQAHLAFALGKAYEDRKNYDKSFEFYKRGNAIRRLHHRYDPKINIYDTVRQIQFFNEKFIADHEGQGCPSPDPIFVVGLPRAGSTLIEQILASHSQVEGTAELTDIIGLSRQIGDRKNARTVSKYPEILTQMSDDDFRELGESYIKTTRIQRSTSPYFIDKMPNNFQHIGLIHSILPNAKIIDARRHPMGGCFSGFKQLFARGQTFTYDLTDIGHYYRDYVKLMDHWDQLLPNRVLRVQYEDMVADTENQIRRLLDYCGLEFEEGCLRFYETQRAIRTPSAEQVRQPIYTKGVEQWRNYETHLDPLKKALGPLLERYPIE